MSTWTTGSPVLFVCMSSIVSHIGVCCSAQFALRPYLYLLLHTAVAGPAALWYGSGAGQFISAFLDKAHRCNRHGAYNIFDEARVCQRNTVKVHVTHVHKMIPWLICKAQLCTFCIKALVEQGMLSSLSTKLILSIQCRQSEGVLLDQGCIGWLFCPVRNPPLQVFQLCYKHM